MTREDMLAQIDDLETFASTELPFVEALLASEEEEGGWVAMGTMPKPPGKRHDKRGEREAMGNEAEVRLQRIPQYCQHARQEIDSGDGDKALAYVHLATHDRQLVEPILADLRSRVERKADGARSSGNSCKPRKK